jgi:hypothetical protein
LPALHPRQRQAGHGKHILHQLLDTGHEHAAKPASQEGRRDRQVFDEDMVATGLNSY